MLGLRRYLHAREVGWRGMEDLMPRKPRIPATPPLTPAPIPAAHVQSAIARAAQAKTADGGGPSPRKPLPSNALPIPPRPPAPHVQTSLRAAQAKLPDKRSTVQRAEDPADFLARISMSPGGAGAWLRGHQGQEYGSKLPDNVRYQLNLWPDRKRELKDAKPSEDKKSDIPADIARVYNPRKACVLQGLIYVMRRVWGKSSASDLHDEIWTNRRAYQQYSDDAVMDALYVAAGMTKVTAHNGKTAPQLADELAAGRYLVAIRGTSEDHVLILDNSAWMEFDQLHGRGFGPARGITRTTIVSVVYQPP